jgi:SAM-dependent methyltransferase
VALLSRYVTRIRHRAVLPYLRGDVLDLGCGYATTVSLLADGQHYVGIEANPLGVAYLRSHLPGHRFEVRDLDREQLALGDSRFDTILLLAVIEHLSHPLCALRQVPSLLTREGHLLITTPSRLGDRVLRLGVRLGLFHREGVGLHHSVYGAPGIGLLLEQAGLMLAQRRTFLLGANQLFVCKVRDRQGDA